METATKNRLLGATIGCLMLLAPFVAAAQGGPPPPRRIPTIEDEVFVRLHLAKDQKAQVQKLLIELERDMKPLFGEQRKLEDAFEREWISPDPDTGDLKRLHRKLVKVADRIEARGFEFQLALLDILGESQRHDFMTAMKCQRDPTKHPGRCDGPGSKTDPKPPTGGPNPPGGPTPPPGNGPGDHAPPPPAP
ncbi:MAG: hypothetical protein M0R80_10515 [Proteobacteria bacterium]|nr:hypothetical protein [Pseudomonadota bacterium]